MMSVFLRLTKQGIVLFVLYSAAVGFLIALTQPQAMEWWRLWVLLAALYALSCGSFALNQVQERDLDSAMLRTSKRPVVVGEVQAWQAYVLGLVLCAVGLLGLWVLSPWCCALGVATLLLYNGLYTWLKPLSAWAAVVGAVPGAMPVLIGYAALQAPFTAEAGYLFLLMFLWQMPHFWALAIHYRGEYAGAGVPVLPKTYGVKSTAHCIGLYLFCYLALVCLAPLFVPVGFAHIIISMPLVFKVLWEFFKFFAACSRPCTPKFWLPFFMWVNLSFLLFLMAPAVDKVLLYSLL